MIVLGANLTMDRTLRLARLAPGHVQRPRSAVATAGGKAVNVCRAAHAHEVRPRLIANLPGRAGQLVADLLDGEGHDVHRVLTSGEIRSATVILEDDGRATVLNEPGPELSPSDRDRWLAAFDTDARGHAIAVASGSLPPGPAAADLYGEVVRRAHRHGLRIVLDAARADLIAALGAGPDVVTPNLAEARAVLTGEVYAEPIEAVEADHLDPFQGPGPLEAEGTPGTPGRESLQRAALEAAAGLRALGARAALVTVGRHGVAGDGAAGRFWIDAPDVVSVNPIGAGDSFAAGLAVGLERGLALAEATVLAVATGSSSVTTDLAGEVDGDLVRRLIADRRVVVREVA